MSFRNKTRVKIFQYCVKCGKELSNPMKNRIRSFCKDCFKEVSKVPHSRTDQLALVQGFIIKRRVIKKYPLFTCKLCGETKPLRITTKKIYAKRKYCDECRPKRLCKSWWNYYGKEMPKK